MKAIPYGRQSIDENDTKAVIEVLLSDYLTQGPKVTEFEQKFAEYVGAKYAIAVSNATAGLHIACLALGLQKGDKVITTPITFAASANCARYCGGEVWFADINPDTFLLDINSVEKLILSKPQGFFKGIIPVDFAGLSVNREEYRKLADKYNLWIIEDAAHSPGGNFKDSKGKINFTGNGVYEDCAVFSFHPVKHIACGEGGMVTTNNETLHNSLKMLRSHGITKENMEDNHGGWYYEMQTLGLNYRLTDIQAALGISQLSKNPVGVERRNEIAKVYQNAFDQMKIKYQSNLSNVFNAYHLFVIEVENRKELYDYLRECNVFCQIHYIPVHTLPYYRKIDYSESDLSVSENYYNRCISLPMYPSLTDSEQEYIINCIKTFYQ